MRREHAEKEPGPGGCAPGFPVSNQNAAAAASDHQGSVPACLQPRFVQTPSHITRSIRKAAVVSGGAFFGSTASFSQQIPMLICERSCRMAKTLTVNIAPNLKNERGKTKKNKKKMPFRLFSAKNNDRDEKKMSVRKAPNPSYRMISTENRVGPKRKISSAFREYAVRMRFGLIRGGKLDFLKKKGYIRCDF